ncbi:MAG: hypothetical protein EAZ57_05085 [Cytophagales bacterium]|nr:MAG: hypothetical protein EAZ67_00795 [Cytophagales bacterium]TAF61163.1 MAG: hypothetical protein EAZ57_05085 [Cytophagales bacterium]
MLFTSSVALAQQQYSFDNPEKVLYLLSSKGKTHFLIQIQHQTKPELIYVVHRLKNSDKQVLQVQNDKQGLTEVLVPQGSKLDKSFFIQRMQAIYKDIANIKASSNSPAESEEFFKRAVLGL